MTLAVIHSRASLGLHAPLVTVEAHLAKGMPRFTIVGLPEAAVKESKDRVRSALLESGFDFPKGRITINLAPADLPKEGGRFDLPIALSLLIASRQLTCRHLDQYEFTGELALSGALRPIKGILPFALQTQKAHKQLVLPQSNAMEATWVEDLNVYGFVDLLSVCSHLSGKIALLPSTPCAETLHSVPLSCLSEVCGQQQAKRALEISAAGGHSLLMVGSPGTGKTMLASRLNSILPPLTREETLEVAALYSISNHGFSPQLLCQRPFRSPHHTASAVSLVGGGKQPKPGEISLAHHGVLFLDELPEFSRAVLEVLREPLESGTIHLTRAAGQAEYPARFQLIAAMNPCPCGYLLDPKRSCTCSQEQISRYRNKISGPLLDRIDMHIEVPTLPAERLANFTPKQEEESQLIQTRVQQARDIQLSRSGTINAKLGSKAIFEHCSLDKDGKAFLTRAIEQLGLSARAYHRILKVARTIADLKQSEHLTTEHLTEAVHYRKYDRKL